MLTEHNDDIYDEELWRREKELKVCLLTDLNF